MDAADFIVSFFAARSKANVCLASYPNERGDPKHQPVEIYTREIPKVEAFLAKYDKPGRAVYFCVNTVAGKKRSKAHIAEITCLHTDLDFKNIAVERKKIEAVLARLTLPASRIVFSGNGLHVYWLLAQGLIAADVSERVERALHKLAWVLAGDPAVAEIARVMRLPGSHNSKNGEWKNVEVVYSNGYEYSLEQLEVWLESVHEPLLPAVGKKGNGAAAADDDPFVRYGDEAPKEKHIDVEERLAQMQYKGPGETSVHITQRDVIASMIGSGDDPQEVVEYVLAYTKKLGLSWNWKSEERKLRGLCAGMFKRDAGLFEEKYADKVIPDWLKHRLGIDIEVDEELPPKPGKKEKEKKPVEIETYSLPQLDEIQPETPQWIVNEYIMAEVLNGFFGDGGVGKDWLLLQLSIAMAAETQWLGLDVMPGKVLYINVEDQLKHIRWRMEKISQRFDLDYSKLPDRMLLAPMVGKETILAAYSSKDGLVRPTPVYDGVRRVIDAFKPALVIVGNRVNIFGVGQNDDAQARQCINILNALIMDFGVTVIMPGHVSKSGMTDESGTSGTVQWSNGCRHRCLLRYAKDDDDEKIDKGGRILEVKKTNWGQTGVELGLHWDKDANLYVGNNEGITVTKPKTRDENDAEIDKEFMALMRKAMAMKWRLSSQPRANNNIGKLLSTICKLTHRQLWRAFERALAKGLVTLERYGPPSDETFQVILPPPEDNVIRGKFTQGKDEPK